MAVLTGTLDSLDIANSVPIQVDPLVRVLQGNKFALVKLLTAIKRRRVVSGQEYRMDSLKIPDDQVQLSAAILATDTVLTIIDNASHDATKMFKVGDVVKILSTGEFVVVTAVNVTANQLTVTRGKFGTTAAAASANDWMIRMKGADDQGNSAGIGTPTNIVPDNDLNYAMILHEDVSNTTISSAERTFYSNFPTGIDLARAVKSKLIFTEAEKALLFSPRDKDTTGSLPKYRTGGVDWFIGQFGKNVTSVAWSYQNFLNWIEPISRVADNVNNVILIASPALLTKINATENPNVRFTPGQTSFGLKIDTILTPFGEFKLINHPMLVNGLNNVVYALNLDNVQLVEVRPHPQMFTIPVEPQGKLMREEIMYAVFGLDITLPETHGKFIFS